MKEADEEGNGVNSVRVSEPKVLYRYGNFDDYTEKGFTHNEIYFSSPEDFNDPFDSKPHLTHAGPMTERKRHLLKMYQRKHPELSKKQIEMSVDLELIPGGLDIIYLDKAVEKARELMRKQLGICCFSEVRDSILMWAHYANKHTGYCLEFDVKSDFFGLSTRAIKVDYAKLRPELNVLRWDNYPEGELAKSLLIKADDWRYEQEWRIVDSEKGAGTQKFPEDALKGVILGCRISNPDRDKVYRWCRSRKHPPLLFEGKEKQKEFGLDIIEITNY